MSGLLFGAGAFALVAGVVMVGFGIPVNEFSFGNTLIVAGVTAIVGGLIVVGLGVVVSQLQRIAEALSARTPIKSSRPLDIFTNGGSPAPAPRRGSRAPRCCRASRCRSASPRQPTEQARRPGRPRRRVQARRGGLLRQGEQGSRRPRSVHLDRRRSVPPRARAHAAVSM